MIARIGYFEGLTPEQEAESERNLRERFKPAISSQEGFIAAYWLRQSGGRIISFSIWESEDHLRAGGTRANAVPLLPGQTAELIPSPDRAEIWEVVDRA